MSDWLPHPGFRYVTGPKKQPNKGKTLYSCTSCIQRSTVNQAKNNGYMCSHCGQPLKVHAQKMAELEALKRTLRVVS